ncbi:hypothetical protein HNP46_007198 [Pseudomonas nitritireducens]|uniref:Uncharacterized protein n=1 Tax=Pseudomonas nitroreducens TaxID=46680 RepID=A0A7W7KTL6_PSENT|nr:hypothetical protein [Pseudomonas nitritireducens]MBB4868275.1 hypothetical protein [Pseudomonas nitritireducens]
MRNTLLIASALAAVSISTAHAGTYEWTSGWGQGITEHIVDDGNGNGLNISCSSEDDQAVKAYASIRGKEYSSESEQGFDVIVDGTTFSNPFFTDCRACGANFPGFWAALRKVNNLQISANGQTVKLPTKNIAKVLRPLNSKENACKSAW